MLQLHRQLMVGTTFVAASFGLMCSTEVLGASDDTYECSAFDPEFHDDLDLLIYQHLVVDDGPPTAVTQQGIAVRIDPNSNGDLFESTRGDFVEDLAAYGYSQAGPKFSNGELQQVEENFVAYTRRVGLRLAVGVRKYSATAPNCGTLASACLPDDLDGQVPVTANIANTGRKFVYTTEEEALDYRAQAVYSYQDANSPEDNGLRWTVLNNWLQGASGVEKAFEDDGPDWARLQELRTGTGANDRVLKVVTVYDSQVHLVDAANPGSVPEIQVTTGAGFKFAPFLFFAEEYGNNMIVFRETPVMPLAANNADIVIWREAVLGDSDSWVPFLTITAADLGEEADRPYLLSPEAFTYEGETRIIFSSSNTLAVASQSDGNIWIALVDDGMLQYARMNSRAPDPVGIRPRYEGEVYFPTSGPPVIFYSYEALTQGESDCDYVSGVESEVLNVEIRRVILTSGSELP